MSTIQKFQFNENQNLYISIINGVEYFLAKNVCDILELGNTSQALKRVEKEDIILNDTPHPQNLSKLIQMSFVNESGLYQLIFSSRKAEAKKFKKWVFQEVLPAIRKNGQYQTNIYINATKKEMLLLALEQEEKIEKLMLENQDKNNTISKITNIQDSYSLRESACNLMVQEKKLKDFLKNKGWTQYLSDGVKKSKLYSTAYAKTNNFATDKAVLNKAQQKFYHQFRITKHGMQYLIKRRNEI